MDESACAVLPHPLAAEEQLKMKNRKLFFAPTLVAVLNLITVDRVTAQTFTTLYGLNFREGDDPSSLVLSNHTLYGTAANGGGGGSGTVFTLNGDGTSFTNLYSFTRTSVPGPYQYPANADGASPNGLVVLGNTLYGAARMGGSAGNGTLFALRTDGTGFTNLYTFTGSFPGGPNSDGAFPNRLIVAGNTLYGTARTGGSAANGTVFAMNVDGTGFTNLHSFTERSGLYPFTTNSDGALPWAALILSGNTLYGTASQGGSTGNGTVFALNTDGTGFTNLYHFAVSSSPNPNLNYTNSDGANPFGPLILSGSTLYGTARYGGSSGYGTVFKLNTDGTGFSNLHSFTAISSVTNGDGAYLEGGLLLSGDILYGTAFGGGSSGYGTIFAVNTDGTGFINLHNFTRARDGSNPAGELILSGDTLYGTAGPDTFQGGTVFSLSFRRN